MMLSRAERWNLEDVGRAVAAGTGAVDVDWVKVVRSKLSTWASCGSGELVDCAVGLTACRSLCAGCGFAANHCSNSVLSC
jgi:hypothetical protein